MKKIKSAILFFTVLCFLSVGCDQASSQNKNTTNDCGKKATSKNVKSYEDLETVGELTNDKYGLTLQIVANNNEFSKGFEISFNKNGTRRCLLYKTAYFDMGLADNLSVIISPDREFITLPCGEETSGYCIYKMAEIARYFNDEQNFKEGKTGGNYCGGGADTFKTLFEPTDKIEVFSSENEEGVLHEFGGWKSDRRFAFTVKTDGADVRRDFLYDISEKKIYGTETEKSGAAKNNAGVIKILRMP